MDDWHEGVVLLDVPPGDAGEFDREMLERMGHPVRVCHGPPTDALCPLLGGRGCPLFEQAHGIVFKLDLGRDQHREILRRYRQLARPDVPIRVLASPGDAERHADLLRMSRSGPTNPTSPTSTGSPPGSRQPTDWRDAAASTRPLAPAVLGMTELQL